MERQGSSFVAAHASAEPSALWENEPTHIPPVATAVMKVSESGGPEKWDESVDVMCILLHELELGSEYESSFREHSVDMNMLLALSRSDVVHILGVRKLRDRRVLADLQLYVRQLKDKAVRELPEDGRLLTHFDNMRQTLTWFRLSVFLLMYSVYTIGLPPLYARKRFAVALGLISVVYAVFVALYTTYRHRKVTRMIESMHEDYRPDRLSLLIPVLLTLIISIFVLILVTQGSIKDSINDAEKQQASYASLVEPLLFLVLSVA